MSAAAQPTPNGKHGAGAITKAAPVAIAGGLGALAMSLAQANPQVVAQMIAWGPAFVLIVGAIWMVDRHVPPFVEAQKDIARALGGLAVTVEQQMSDRASVQMAVATLAGKFDELTEEVRSWRPKP